MPAQAEALNDRSSMPPVSVTMHALYAAAVLAPPPLGLDAGGGLPQAAAESVSPPAARIATICFPRTGRKTPLLPLHTTPSRCVQRERTRRPRRRQEIAPDCWRTVTCPQPSPQTRRDLG